MPSFDDSLEAKLTNAGIPYQLAVDIATEIEESGGGGGSLTVQEEGTPLTTAATTLNFVGAGVTASGTGATKTITVLSGGDVTLTGSQTLTNKTLTAPVINGAVTGTATLPATVTMVSSPTAADNSLKVATTAYVDTADTFKANVASPTFTGTPAAPTAAAATNTTQLATTAHVFAERTNSATLTNKTLTSPVINTTVTGTATLPATITMLATPSPADNSLKIATTAYADAIATLKANIASPTFTGTPAAPTATPLTNTTQLATTAFVTAAVAASGGGGVTVQEEGSPLTTTATTLNFVGSGVTATGAGATKTITVTGGGDVTLVGAQTLTNKYIGDSGSVLYGGQADFVGAAMYPRADSASNFTTHNPVLRNTEMGWEYDTGKAKMGDGVTAWTSLDYFVEPYIAPSAVVLGAGPTAITHDDHSNRSVVSRQSVLAQLVFAATATSGAVQGDLVTINNRGVGHLVATGAIYADVGFKLWAKPGESLIAEYDSVADAYYSKTVDLQSIGGTELNFAYIAIAGSASPSVTGLVAPSAYDSSTQILRALATTNKFTHIPRVSYVGTAAAINEGAGFVHSTNAPFRAPTAAIPYGFKVRFVAAGADANAAGFMGMGLVAAAPVVTAQPSVAVNTLWVAHDATDTQFTIMHTDASGPANKLPLNGGSGFPAHTNGADMIETVINFRSDGTGRWALVSVRNTITNVAHTELITTDLPAEGTTLFGCIVRGSLNSGTPATPTLDWSWYGAGMFA